jgi:YfiR/HmsC-like
VTERPSTVFPGVAWRAIAWKPLRLVRLMALCAALLAWISAAGGWAASEDSTGSLEHSVKAAFLYKFLGYVEWPAEAFTQPDTPIGIGVLSGGEIADELARIVSGRNVNGRPITVKRLKEGDSLAGIHMLFIGRSESARLSQLVKAAHQRPILTVTEAQGALTHGSVINFVLADSRVRFEVSLEAADRSGIKLSSRMLAVAYNLRGGKP